MLPLLAGTALSVAGVACLFGSWNGVIASHLWPRSLGWALLVASVVAWSFASGAEFGVALALILPGVIAWMCALRTAEVREQRQSSRSKKPRPEPVSEVAGPRPVLRHLLLFLFAVPLAAGSAALISIALCSLLPWRDVNEMVLALLVMPFVWGCAAYWVIADPRLSRPVIALLAGSALSAALLYL